MAGNYRSLAESIIVFKARLLEIGVDPNNLKLSLPLSDVCKLSDSVSGEYSLSHTAKYTSIKSNGVSIAGLYFESRE